MPGSRPAAGDGSPAFSVAATRGRALTSHAASQPRGAGGRFAATSHAEPGTALTAPDTAEAIHARRLETARYVLAEFGEMEILDHSPARQDTVLLGDLGDPRLALGNCWAASTGIIEEVGAAELDAEWLEEITISRHRVGGQHVAILAGDGDGEFVIDYTARQFHPGLPFPYVAGVEAWQAAVERASGTRWIRDG